MSAPPGKPSPPRLFGANADEQEQSRGTSSLHLLWDPGLGALAYTVVVNGTDWTTSPTTDATAINLAADTSYVLNVRASIGTLTTLSDPVTIATRPDPPPAPTLADRHSDASGATLTVSWPIVSPYSYDLQVNNQVTAGVSPPHTYQSLTPDTEYLVRLQVVHDGIASDWSQPLDNYTQPVPPDPPTLASPADQSLGDVSVTLSWNPVAPFAYDLRRDADDSLIKSDVTPPDVVGSLASNTGYRFQLRVRHFAHQNVASDWSGPLDLVTRPPAPSGITLAATLPMGAALDVGAVPAFPNSTGATIEVLRRVGSGDPQVLGTLPLAGGRWFDPSPALGQMNAYSARTDAGGNRSFETSTVSVYGAIYPPPIVAEFGTPARPAVRLFDKLNIRGGQRYVRDADDVGEGGKDANDPDQQKSGSGSGSNSDGSQSNDGGDSDKNAPPAGTDNSSSTDPAKSPGATPAGARTVVEGLEGRAEDDDEGTPDPTAEPQEETQPKPNQPSNTPPAPSVYDVPLAKDITVGGGYNDNANPGSGLPPANPNDPGLNSGYVTVTKPVGYAPAAAPHSNKEDSSQTAPEAPAPAPEPAPSPQKQAPQSEATPVKGAETPPEKEVPAPSPDSPDVKSPPDRGRGDPAGRLKGGGGPGSGSGGGSSSSTGVDPKSAPSGLPEGTGGRGGPGAGSGLGTLGDGVTILPFGISPFPTPGSPFDPRPSIGATMPTLGVPRSPMTLDEFKDKVEKVTDYLGDIAKASNYLGDFSKLAGPIGRAAEVLHDVGERFGDALSYAKIGQDIANMYRGDSDERAKAFIELNKDFLKTFGGTAIGKLVDLAEEREKEHEATVKADQELAQWARDNPDLAEIARVVSLGPDEYAQWAKDHPDSIIPPPRGFDPPANFDQPTLRNPPNSDVFGPSRRIDR